MMMNTQKTKRAILHSGRREKEMNRFGNHPLARAALDVILSVLRWQYSILASQLIFMLAALICSFLTTKTKSHRQKRRRKNNLCAIGFMGSTCWSQGRKCQNH